MMDEKTEDVVSLDDSPDTGMVEPKKRGYKYARTEKQIITSDPAIRDSENKRHQDLLRKIYEATSPDTSVNELIKEETEHYRYQDMLTFSAASGVDFFKMAPLSFALRDKYYFTPTIVSESILSDDQQAKKTQIRPKGFTVKLKQGGKQKEYRIGALFDLPYGGFAMQIGAAVQQIPAKSGKKTKNSVQLMMFSPNFMRLIEEYDQETGSDKGTHLIRSMQRMWGYQTHDHLHAIVRDFDDKPPAGFKRFDHALHHGRQLGGKDVLEGFGPFPITTPESNEYMSLLAVQEGWKIKFLADSKGFDFGRPTDSHAVRQKRMQSLAKWIDGHKDELQNFDWEDIRNRGKRYASFVDEISDFDKGVREFAEWAAKKKGEPKLQKDIENFCFVSYVHLALNILPARTPEIKKILDSHPDIVDHPSIKLMGGLHELNGKVPEGGKIGKTEDTTSIWSFIRAYGDALGRSTKTDLSLGHGETGVHTDQDFHKAHNEIFDAYQAINADDIDVKTRIQQATSIIGRKPELYQTTYNSVLYSLSKQILQSNVINQYHVERLQTMLGVGDEISGHAAPTFQEVVDIWHLQHMLPSEKPGRIIDQWQHLKAREFARYVMGKDSISEAAYEAVQELLESHTIKSSEKGEYTKEIIKMAEADGIELHHDGKDDMSKGQHTRLDKLEHLLNAEPDSKIDAITSITPGRVAELRVQVG